jgi:hypothetical protein
MSQAATHLADHVIPLLPVRQFVLSLRIPLRLLPAAQPELATPVLQADIPRLALANERVQTDAAGQVVLKLKAPWRDGARHLVMSPMEYMQRLAALVPRPRLHLIRFHGVLAPNAKQRAMVVPQEPEPSVQAAPPAECQASCAHHRPVRLSWARLLKRVFDLDLEHCPNCGGELKIIAAILEQPVIEKILTDLSLQALRRHAHLRVKGPCRRPEHGPPSSVERPGTTGRWDRLRARFSGPGQCGPVACANPQTSAGLGACGRVYRRSAATVDYKNRIRRLDRRARLPHRHGNGAFQRTIL